MFDSVKLSPKMSIKTRGFVMLNALNAKKTVVACNDGKYEKYLQDKLSLFDFIMSKKELSLSDAIQVMKYGNKKFREDVIKLILNTNITDTRFKSTTFVPTFAQYWKETPYINNTKMVQNMTVKKGTQAKYSNSKNAQVEFILNDSPKNITFQNVVYDEKTDTIILDSTVTPKLD